MDYNKTEIMSHPLGPSKIVFLIIAVRMTPFVVPWSKHIPGRQVRTSLVFYFFYFLSQP